MFGLRSSDTTSATASTVRCGGGLVGRAALGSSYVELDPDAVTGFRAALPGDAFSTVLDAPAALRGQLDPWGTAGGPALELMRSVKARFDPAMACNRGLFVGGI